MTMVPLGRDDAEGRDVEHDLERLAGHEKVENDAEQPDERGQENSAIRPRRGWTSVP